MLPAPSAVLVSGAFHLTVTRLLLATFCANWWSPVRAIEQGDPVEEGHLTQFLDLLSGFNLDLYFDLGGSTIRTTCLFMLPVTTYGAGLLLPPRAFLCLVSPLLATETLDLARMAVHEDRPFYRSVNTGNEW